MLCSVEAAGGGGLQLFVDSNMSVDSALIRQLVDEVLTEHIALMLGHRDTQTGPEPGLEPPNPGPGAPEEVQTLRSKPSLSSVCSLSEPAAGSVPGGSGATGSYTSTDPSTQSDPAQQRDPASDHTPSV